MSNTKEPLIIELFGANFVNRGAEMMLRECVRRLNVRFPNALLAMPAGQPPFDMKAELKLYNVARLIWHGVNIGVLTALIPARYRHAFGLLIESETRVMLDISGYSYYGNRDSIARLARQARIAKRDKRKIILLPQSFGPFDKNKRDQLSAIVDNSDLIFPRDILSYQYIADIVGERANIHVAPDITPTFPSVRSPEYAYLNNRLCIIPNQRMIKDTTGPIQEAYVPFMRQCLLMALHAGLKPYILIHETNDHYLGNSIAKDLIGKEDVISFQDPHTIKGLIGSASAVISSRFHGLVSALSQSVPALGTGWCHKYEMLFNDYGIKNGLIPLPCDEALLQERLSMIFDASSRKRITEQLNSSSSSQENKIESMWERVFRCIQS